MSSHHQLSETIDLRTPRHGYRRAALLAVFVTALTLGGLWAYGSLFASTAPVVELTDTHAERRLRVAALSSAEKEELARQQERFTSLTPAEQDRLRKLHADLTADPNGPQLMAVAAQYHEWLKTLSTGQRAELLDLAPEKRIVRIQELRRQEEARQFSELINFELPKEDVELIFSSVSNFIRENEDRIIANLSDRQKMMLNRVQDEQRRTRTLFFLMLRQGPRDNMPMPDREGVEQLISSLSQATQARLQSVEDPAQQADLLRSWIWAAVISRTSPEEATTEQLEKFFAELPQTQRERLESLPSEQMQHELRRLFYQDQHGFRHPGRDWRGDDHEGPGPGWGDRPGPPHERGDGRPPEDRRRGEDRPRQGPEDRDPRPPRGEGREPRAEEDPPAPPREGGPPRRRPLGEDPAEHVPLEQAG